MLSSLSSRFRQAPAIQKNALDSPPITPTENPIDGRHATPRAPCEFMPQSPSPVMLVSSTRNQRTSQKYDDRALRLLTLYPRVKARAHGVAGSTYGGKTSFDTSDSDGSDGSDGSGDTLRGDTGRNTSAHVIHTPPETPTTSPGQRKWCEVKFSVFGVCVLFKGQEIPVLLRWWVLEFALLVLLSVVVIFGPMQAFLAVAVVTQMFSNAMETVLRGFGFVCGRSVARFWEGFQRGLAV